MSISREHFILAMAMPSEGELDTESVSEYVKKYGGIKTFLYTDDANNLAKLKVNKTTILEAKETGVEFRVPITLRSPSSIRFLGGLSMNPDGIMPSTILTPKPALVPYLGYADILSRLQGALDG